MNSMIISIDTYRNLNDPLYSTVSGRLLLKDLVIKEDLKDYTDLDITSVFTESHIRSVIEGLKVAGSTNESKRIYKSILGIKCDTAFEIEMLGVERYSKKHTVLFSLQDSLDYVLHILCGVDPSKVRKIPHYQRLSRGILNVDVDLLDELSFGHLIGIDEKLDKYIAGVNRKSFDYADFVTKFFTELTECCNGLLHTLAMKYKCYYKEQGINLALKSKTITSVAFSSDVSISDEMQIMEDYFIKINSYTKKRYINHVDDLCSRQGA